MPPYPFERTIPICWAPLPMPTGKNDVTRSETLEPIEQTLLRWLIAQASVHGFTVP